VQPRGEDYAGDLGARDLALLTLCGSDAQENFGIRLPLCASIPARHRQTRRIFPSFDCQLSLHPSANDPCMTRSLAKHAEAIIKEAQARHLTLATVESCTAGSLGLLLADAPGASNVFHGGFIVYTKANKTAALGVPPPLIETHTAVSRQVAEAMARGGIERCPADIAIAITGVAGPEPDEDGNPVGLVHIAAASRDGRGLHMKADFGPHSREESRALTLDAALRLLDAMVNGAAPNPTPA
jgi:nicotinamide-nucleotide amidase